MLSVSLAYNLVPISPVKRVLARFDQAAIFLFIAGTYTPFLAVMGNTHGGTLLGVLVWGASLVGIALKLIVPHRFGRLAVLLYLAIGWSGVLVFGTLAATLPARHAVAAGRGRHRLLARDHLPPLGPAEVQQRALAHVRRGRRDAAPRRDPRDGADLILPA